MHPRQTLSLLTTVRVLLAVLGGMVVVLIALMSPEQPSFWPPGCNPVTGPRGY